MRLLKSGLFVAITEPVPIVTQGVRVLSPYREELVGVERCSLRGVVHAQIYWGPPSGP